MRLFPRATQLGIRIATGAILLVVLTPASPLVADVFHVVEESNPPGVFLTTSNGFNFTGTAFSHTTQTAPHGGVRCFTHWSVDGIRQTDEAGRSINPALLAASNNITAVANYIFVTNDVDMDGVADCYEREFFDTLAEGSTDDSDDDTFTLAQEQARGYHPRLRNSIIEGGLAARRIGLTIVPTNYLSCRFLSYPEDRIIDTMLFAAEGTPVISPNYSDLIIAGWRFGSWKLDGVRQTDPAGVAVGQLSFTLSSNRVATARFWLADDDSDGDRFLDWFEDRHFGTLDESPASNYDGDEFVNSVEQFRGYNMRLSDNIVEGGVTARRGAQFSLSPSNYLRFLYTTDPRGVFEDSGGADAMGTVQTSPDYTGRLAPGDLRFSGWDVGGVRQADDAGLALGQLVYTLQSNVVATAHFIPILRDLDQDGISDWYELLYYGHTNPGDDSDMDGFSLSVEKFRDYHPRLLNTIVAGGVIARRSSLLTFTPSPPVVAVQPTGGEFPGGTEVTLTVDIDGIGPFTYQWRLNGAAIPRETGLSLTIPDVQATNSGVYTLSVRNPFGVTTSDAAEVLVSSTPFLLLADNLANCTPFTVATRTIRSSNTNTTRELGEPSHAQKVGSNSVWICWTAPSNGVATWSTRGSSIDTLLGIYTGTSVADLTFVASDEDGGGFFTSEVSFNATMGTNYNIAIDGFAGRNGNLVISWNLNDGAMEVPVITAQPKGVSVRRGEDAVFQVVAFGTALAYQWFQGSNLLAGEASDSLLIRNAQPDHVGPYRVRISNPSSGIVVSDPAVLELGSVPRPTTQDKLEDLLSSLGAGDGGGGGAGAPSPMSVALGIPAVIEFSNEGATTQEGENHCDIIASSTRWDWVASEEPGVIDIDTRGSGIPTALAIYSFDDNFQERQIACDTFGGPDQRSRICFEAEGRTLYAFVTDGRTNRSGIIRVTANYFPLNREVHDPSTLMLRSGETVVLRSADAAEIQWLRDGEVISTSRSLILCDVGPEDSGSYTVIETPERGPSIEKRWVVDVEPPVLLDRDGIALEGPLDGEEFQWYRNGTPLIGQTNRLLRVAYLPGVNVGFYSVVSHIPSSGVTTNLWKLSSLLPGTLSYFNGQLRMRIPTDWLPEDHVIEASPTLLDATWSRWTNAVIDNGELLLDPAAAASGRYFRFLSP